MNTQRNHKVRVENLEETERLLLKMIFSVSRTAPSRRHGYELCADAEACDVVIAAGDGARNAGTAPVLVVDNTAGPNRIERPLLATRVLRLLDGLVAQQAANTVPAAPLAAVESVLSAPIDREQGLASFEISAEEAQELAIVQDEALEHPSNHEAGFEQITLTAPDEHVPSPTPAAGDAAQVRRVLVVDDSASVRKQLEIELTHFDAEVDYAATGRQAIDLIEAKHYDVALLDVVLPDWDGFEICKKVKAVAPKTVAVMLTAKATQADKLKGTLAGCDAYMVKPVGRRAFQSVVTNYLPLAKASQALSA
jgi:CheY-like chemotaxis protein